jgi:hypothetical protein
MPKNTKGGSGHKKTRNRSAKGDRRVESLRKSQDQDAKECYGKITKACGNRGFMVLCQKPDEPESTELINCRMRGSVKMRVYADSYVLVQHFGFSEQAQIIDAYSMNEVELLKSYGYWDYPDTATTTAGTQENRDFPESEDEEQSGSEGQSEGQSDGEFNSESDEDNENRPRRKHTRGTRGKKSVSPVHVPVPSPQTDEVQASQTADHAQVSPQTPLEIDIDLI